MQEKSICVALDVPHLWRWLCLDNLCECITVKNSSTQPIYKFGFIDITQEHLLVYMESGEILIKIFFSYCANGDFLLSVN